MKHAMILAGAAIVVIAVAVALLPLIGPERLQTTDFVNFYVGASIVRQGQGAQLYQRSVQDQAFQAVLGHASRQYFLHPAFEAAAFVPLTYLGMERGFALWSLINVALLSLLPLVLVPSIQLVERRPYLAWSGFCLLPALTALTLGQDSIVLLVVLSASHTLTQKQKDLAAGLVLSLLSIKFQYLVILLPLLLWSRKWRTAAGAVIGCACLGLLSVWITGWSGQREYVAFLLDFNAHSGHGALNPTLMVNVRGFLAGLGVAAHLSAYALLSGAVLLALAMLCSAGSQDRTLRWALYITVALVAAPYAHFPDMTMLLLPVLLALDYIVKVGTGTVLRRLLAFGCAAIFLWPFALLLLGGHFWWNSRIYWVFPVIALFAAVLGVELQVSKRGAIPGVRNLSG
ncbi:MAG TPA: glycosyltransferase family 87 protein [Terriglobales bacterium]|jgi:hypothetical protein|nr:glycosyltransferase family 87 protein [Terriglobales bacterium]